MEQKFTIEHPGEVIDHPFPPTRPDIKIVESSDRIIEVDCQELQWWFAIPKMGERYMWAEYDGATQKLDAVTEMIPTAPATIRDIDCVEIQFKEWLAKDWPPSPDLMYVAIDETHTRWISVVNTIDGRRIFNTIGDEWFEAQWGGPCKRRIVDDGRYQLQPDGSYKLTDGQGFGAGTYHVTIGENTFHCLRVLDADITKEHGDELAEVYIEEETGRTVFFRRYDGRYLRGDLLKKFPNNRRIVINDITYIHSNCTGWFHDTFTLASFGKTLSTTDENKK
ncbi:MAG: hypothetical protein OXI43_06275 [Candidatus Poribacteria bacterium]|nr:hypothetical protein [Candidatus Poribacteria bacterium]